MKIVLCGFGNPDNRGCEAIIRSTTRMTKNVFPSAEIIATSNDYLRVKMLPLDTVDKYDNSYYPHDGMLSSYIYAACRKLFGSAYTWCKLQNSAAYKRIGKADLCISVGGDNFCYSNRIDHFLVHHDHFKNIGAKLIHWGSSFEKDFMTKKLVSDLNKFDAIMVRESISYDAVTNAGVTSPVYLIPDPAFIMGKETADIEEKLEDGCVGLNISPMIISKESKNGIVKKNAINLINHITDSGRQVVLIPHVADRKTGDGDYSVMKELLNEVANPERCLLIGYEYSAPQLKSIISKCAMFIGARTHATIAAYSTCVPTFVIGYSVKARGIAKDLFGTDKGYCLPVQSIKEENELVDAYCTFEKQADDIRNHLQKIMPEYIEKAKSAERIIFNTMSSDK